MSKFPRYKLAEMLARKSLGRFNEKAFSQEVAAYLLEEGRVSELDSLLRDVMQYRAEEGVVEAVAVSAHPLSAQSRHDIEAELHVQFPDVKQIIVTEEVDASVVGGVRLELANQQLDLSVRAKLNDFKQLTAAGRN